MNKKVIFFIVLCVLGLCTSQVQAVNIITSPNTKLEIADPPTGYEIIELQGTLMFGLGPNAIVAGANDNSVYIGFNQDFGNVSISIYNGMGGLVYSTVVDTDVQQVVIIPFTTAASGSYTVELNNASGSADGDFSKE